MSDTRDVHRVLIIGTSGCGKTTLARKLSKILNAPDYDLDNLFWLPQWRQRSDDDFHNLVQEVISKDRWIICGNYSKVQQAILTKADCLIWLDYSLMRCLWWTLKRSVQRIITQEPCSGNNQESFVRNFLSRNSIFLWILQTYSKRKIAYRDLFARKSYDLQYWRFSSPKDLDEWIKRGF